MIYYTSDGCKYEGMDQSTITSLRTALGLTTTFVDVTTFNTYVAAHALH